ncbi:hypothetical protein ABZW30_12485 [Kitasatospora sp. NPDC004669]|uniref:hypothetical protein n=1 Tax=Kitasatospora sp. NPDC004669 TaxID=3154555 RepID=UPI0033AC004F
MDHITLAIDTAAQYQIAAPEQANAAGVNGAQGGAFIIGIIIAAILITKWRSKAGGLSDETKKAVIAAVVMTVCLYGGSGIVGSLLGQVKSTADQTGATIQQTSVGR